MMLSKLETLAAQVVEINDFRLTSDEQKRDIMEVCKDIKQLDSLNEVLAVDLAVHVIRHHIGPDAPLLHSLEDFMLGKIRLHSDLMASMVLSSRVLFETGRRDSFQNEVFGFVADNLPRFNNMYNVSLLAPNLLVQIFSEPGASERQISAAFFLDRLATVAESNPLQASGIIRRVMDCSLEMTNPAEQAIVGLGHRIQPKVSIQSVGEGGLLALRVGLHSPAGSIQQRVATVRVLEAIEQSDAGSAAGYSSSVTMQCLPRGYKSAEPKAVPAIEPEAGSPVWLARGLIQQGLAINGAPYQRLMQYLHLMLPTLPADQQRLVIPMLAGQENGILRDPAHPLRGQIRAYAAAITAQSYYAHLSARKPFLGGFMPRCFRTDQGTQPA